MAVEGVALIYCMVKVKKEACQKTRADLPSRWRAGLSFLLLEEKLTKKKKKGRSAPGQEQRTPLLGVR